MTDWPEASPSPADGSSRADLLRRGGLAAAGGVVGAAVLTRAVGVSAQSAGQEQDVLNLLLLVERTEEAFYREALSDARLTGEMQEFAQVALEHETEHVAALEDALGSAADEPPTFDFGDATQSPDAFAQAAADLEDVAVAALQRSGRQRRARRVPGRGPDRLRRGPARGLDPQHRGSRPGARRRRLAEHRGAGTAGAAADRGDGMSTDFGLDLARLDRDGALAEARAGLSRRGLLVGVAAGAGGALLLRGGVARAQTAADVDVLNYALVLEYLQAAFYTEAERSKAIKNRAAAGGREGRRRRAGARPGVPRPPRGQGGQAAAVRLPGRDGEGALVPQDGRRLRGPRRSRPTRARRGTSRPRRSSRARWGSTRSRRATRRGCATSTASARPCPPSTSRASRSEINRIVRRTGFITTSAKTRSSRAPRYTG